MFIVLVVIALTFLLANAALYCVPFVFTAALVAGLGWQKWYRMALASAIIIALSVLIPIGINAQRHRDRTALAAEDIPLAKPPVPIHHLALLFDSDSIRNQYGWPNTSRTDSLRQWYGLLLNKTVESVLVGYPRRDSPDPVHFPSLPDQTAKLTRYRIERRAWCPLVQIGTVWPSMDELTRIAEGNCIVAAPATLADADAVLAMESLPYNALASGAAVQANRFTLLQSVDGAWRTVYRETSVGGADLIPPLLILDGGGIMGPWLELNYRVVGSLHPLSPDARMASLGLATKLNPEPTEDERRDVVRRILGDGTIPRDSAQSQFLAAYVLVGGWKHKDLDLVSSILHDERVVYFNNDTPNEPTPPVLARPLAERMLHTDLSRSMAEGALSWNHGAVRFMVYLFSELPRCASLAARDLVDEAMRDPDRRTDLLDAKRKVEDDSMNKVCSN